MVPVAAEGETVAVSVKVTPAVGVVVDAVSVVVVVVPVDPGACQKSPQPARNGAVASASSIRIFPLRTAMSCILRPLRRVGEDGEKAVLVSDSEVLSYIIGSSSTSTPLAASFW
jgi:hypothetical protein